VKARVTLVVGIAALLVGLLIGRWARHDSANGQEPGKAEPEADASAAATPARPADIDRLRLLPAASAVYLHIDVPRLAAQRDQSRMPDLFRRPETSGVVAAFFRSAPPAFINAATESLAYGGEELDLSLVPKDPKSGDGPFQLVVSGKTEDATKHLDAFLRVGLAPLFAGGTVATATEELMGLPLVGASGPKGGLYWTQQEGEFLAAREKPLLSELLAMGARLSAATEPGTGFPPPETWNAQPIRIHVDFEKAQKSGVLPKGPDPNAPVLLSALALAAQRGFESLDLTGGYSDGSLRLSVTLKHQNEIAPIWRSLHPTGDPCEGLPAGTLAAVAVGFPGGPPAPETAPTAVPGASGELTEGVPYRLRLLQRAFPTKGDLVSRVLGPSAGVAVCGAFPVTAAGEGPGYFLSLPYPGAEAVEAVLEWAKQEGAAVASVAFFGLSVFDLDFHDRPILGAQELERIVLARVGDRLVAATHPDILRALDPGTDTPRLGEAEQYSALRSALERPAPIRAYVSPELLRTILQGHRRRLDWSRPGAADVDRMLQTLEAFAAPLLVSIGPDGRSLELELVSQSDVAAMTAAAFLHRVATHLLIRG